MQWIAAHSQSITALTSIGTLLVWVAYLQLFVHSYRRQLRATLLITRGAGDDLDARCFLSNMSSGSVYIESVLVTVQAQSGATVRPVTDIRNAEGEITEEAGRWTRQGPLGSGEARDLGSFRSLMGQALTNTAGVGRIAEAQIESITIQVIGIYGAEDLPVGARRTFILRTDGRTSEIAVEELSTRQIRSRHDRRRLVADLQKDR